MAMGLLSLSVLIFGAQQPNTTAAGSIDDLDPTVIVAGSAAVLRSASPELFTLSSVDLDPKLSTEDLPNVAVKRDDLGSEYGNPTTVTDEPLDLEDTVCAPATSQALANGQWRGGYIRRYASPAGQEVLDSGSVPSQGDVLWVGSVSYLLGDASQATNVFHAMESDFSRNYTCGNTTWESQSSDSPTVCDSSAARVHSALNQGIRWTHTEVLFQRGALLTRVFVARFGQNAPWLAEADRLAKTVCDRINFVSSQEDRKVIFIQGIDSASGPCGSTFRNEYSWMVNGLLASPQVRAAAPTLDNPNDFFYFSYSGNYCPLGGSPDYARPQYQKSDTCAGVKGDGQNAGGAEKLQWMIEGLRAKYPRVKFDIFAHSMGGMVVSYWLSKDYENRAPLINSVTTFDSPLRGTTDKNPFSSCDHQSPAWKNLYCEEWEGQDAKNDKEHDKCQSVIVYLIREVAREVPFYTTAATQHALGYVFVPGDRTTLLASHSEAHCSFDDGHSSLWKNADLGGNKPIECWDDFRWPDDPKTDPADGRIVKPSIRAEVKPRFIACGIRGLSGTACIDSLGVTLMSDATTYGSSSPGATSIAIAGGDGIDEGDYVVINPGMSNEETKKVTALGSLIFDDALAFAHQPGERIFRLDSPSFVAKQGDADCDGQISSVDALVVLRATAQLVPLADCLDGSDTDCNGTVDAVDALGVLRYLAALADRPPIGCTAIASYY